MGQLAGVALGIFILVLEVAGLVAGFAKGAIMGFVALFIPPVAWWLGFEKLFM